MCCDLLQLLARKITKRIHSSKPASPNRLKLGTDWNSTVHHLTTKFLSLHFTCVYYEQQNHDIHADSATKYTQKGKVLWKHTTLKHSTPNPQHNYTHTPFKSCSYMEKKKKKGEENYSPQRVPTLEQKVLSGSNSVCLKHFLNMFYSGNVVTVHISSL